ncbi:hypothetical protein V8C26DRAFT_407495 [Trichoderma gracile]
MPSSLVSFPHSQVFPCWNLVVPSRFRVGMGEITSIRFLNAEEARQELKDEAAEDDEREHSEPEQGDGRLGRLLCALLELVLRLAHLGLLVFGELGVAPALLEGLGLFDCSC